MVSLLCVEFHNTERDLSQNLLRMHIIANSNSNTDQSTKLKVRDNILKEMGEELSSYNSASDAKISVLQNLNKIKSIAEKTLVQNGINDNVNVTLENTLFPQKTYNDITLPKGRYDALRVEIGEAKGQNWWCVMFPPLCFTEDATGEMKEEDKDKLKSSLDETERELITSKKETVRIKFKLYELWQDGKEAFNSIINKPEV